MSRIACIGHRNAPASLVPWMEHAGAEIVKAGHVIVSGNAIGSDQAWARGGNSVDSTKVELWLPWAGYNRRAIVEGNIVHVYQAEGFLGRGVDALLGRNRRIVDDVKAVMVYMVPGSESGTGRAVRLAKQLGCHRIYNIYHREQRELFDEVAINGAIFP